MNLIRSLALEEGAARKLNKRELLKHKSTEELPKSCCSIVKKSLFYAKLIIDPQGPCANEIALILCMTAAFLDPMFFYTRVINDDKRCISVEKSWGIAATLLRSVFDLFYIFHYTSTSGLINLYKTARTRFFMDLVVIFPLPQHQNFSDGCDFIYVSKHEKEVYLECPIRPNFSTCAKINPSGLITCRKEDFRHL
ncbi:hypothetical protein Patl1_25792 [Pistacia atlantica]|uniref:Uncharacterized protein n=1 Tax=Pistacia atlantica TaxID=434234 RepID=A0ACC1B3P0_9ROSI|nr:hypothetical protein Patl1_25792 [Pistacia atlantica]